MLPSSSLRTRALMPAALMRRRMWAVISTIFRRASAPDTALLTVVSVNVVIDILRRLFGMTQSDHARGAGLLSLGVFFVPHRELLNEILFRSSVRHAVADERARSLGVRRTVVAVPIDSLELHVPRGRAVVLGVDVVSPAC